MRIDSGTERVLLPRLACEGEDEYDARLLEAQARRSGWLLGLYRPCVVCNGHGCHRLAGEVVGCSPCDSTGWLLRGDGSPITYTYTRAPAVLTGHAAPGVLGFFKP